MSIKKAPFMKTIYIIMFFLVPLFSIVLTASEEINQHTIHLVAAYQTDRGMGYQNQLPWKLKADLQHFRKLTLDHTIIMGRKTHESIGRVLDGRRNIVISKTYISPLKEVEIYPSIQTALEHVKAKDNIFIIGGEQPFEEAFPLADYLHLTVVDALKPVDRFFPDFNEEEWEKESENRISSDEENEFSYRIQSWRRKSH